jgi:hypothetical protein
MFPISQPAEFYLIQITVLLISALAMQFGWRRGLALVVIAVAIPTGHLWINPPTGQYAGLGYFIRVIAPLSAMVGGIGLGWVVRRICKSLLFSITVLFAIYGALAGSMLWNQYIPNACLKAPLLVQISGRVLHLPVEMRPVVKKGEKTGFFGRADRRSEGGWLCREGRNGTKIIDVDTVSISPVSSQNTMTAACVSNKPPKWCDRYSPKTFSTISGFKIGPASEHTFPMPYWTTPNGSLLKDLQGDLIKGSVCLTPNPKHETLTQCWIWEPFGDGTMLTVRTHNVDPIFKNMPIGEAREMIRKLREMVLAIIVQ